MVVVVYLCSHSSIPHPQISPPGPPNCKVLVGHIGIEYVGGDDGAWLGDDGDMVGIVGY